MQWGNKDITALTNQELIEASEKLIQMYDYRKDKLENKKLRHEKMDFTNSNPLFNELKIAIGKEIVNRGL